MGNAEIIQSLELNKEEIANVAFNLTNAVTEDGMNPLKLLIQLKAIQKVAEQVIANINDLAIDEACKYGKDEKVFGAKISVKEVGTKYDYTHCTKWNNLQAEIDAIKAKQKAIETALKIASEDVPFVDNDSGEIITQPAPKKSTTTVAVTF